MPCPPPFLRWQHPSLWERDCVTSQAGDLWPEAGLEARSGQCWLTPGSYTFCWSTAAEACSWGGLFSVCFLSLPWLAVSCRPQSPYHSLLWARRLGCSPQGRGHMEGFWPQPHVLPPLGKAGLPKPYSHTRGLVPVLCLTAPFLLLANTRFGGAPDKCRSRVTNGKRSESS